MTQNTKNLLMIGGVAVVGFLIYKQMSKPKNFSNYVDDDFYNVSGTRRARMGSPRMGGGSDICGEGCIDGRCRVAVYGEDGTIRSYYTISCTGTGESGYGTTILQGKI